MIERWNLPNIMGIRKNKLTSNYNNFGIKYG